MGTNADRGLRYDLRLIEETVLLAVRGRPEARAFHAERDRFYVLVDPEDRNRAFQQHHAQWFNRFGLGDVIEQALSEQPEISERVRACVIGRATGRQDEGAELFVGPADEALEERERRSVALLLRPESLLEPDSLLLFLRHELFHIADMLNPAFAYEPAMPQAQGGPTYDRLLQDRYRTLWDATIDGRLVRRGWAPASRRDDRWREFARTFSMLQEETAKVFDYFFGGESHTHAELLSFAFNPTDGCSRKAPVLHPGSRCALCQFPTHAFERRPEDLPAEVIRQINRDFPEWRPAQGLCPQCADLYRASVTH